MHFPKAALTVTIALLLVLSSGCLKKDDATTVYIKLEVIGDTEQNVVQGSNTTFLIALQNDHNKNATLDLSLEKLPKGWNHSFDPPTVDLLRNKGTSVLLNLTVPRTAENRGFGMKAVAKMKGRSDQTASESINVYVLDVDVPVELKVVSGGETVYFNYTGFLTNGTVFDSTYEEVGTDGRVRKAAEWQAKSIYDPQPFRIGSHEAIRGFEEGVLGMRQGEYKTIYIPEELAYSIYQNVTINLTERIPMREQWDWSEFTRAFRQDAAMHLIVTHRQWNVTCEVVAIDNETEGHPVTIELQPTIGQIISPYGWDTRVVSVDSTADGGKGVIVLENLVTASDVGKTYHVYNSTAPKEIDEGVVTEVVAGSHLVMKVQRSHNALAGKDLIFNVKVHEFAS
jgi:FKBP-type peptidyl-prolyl cis-trans isomerase 2